MKHPIKFLIIVASIFSLAQSCTKGTSQSTSGTTINSGPGNGSKITVTYSAVNGAILTAADMNLILYPGALAQDADISAAAPQSIPALPMHLIPVSTAYDFSPDGSAFSFEAAPKLKFTYDSIKLANLGLLPENIMIYWFDPVTGTYVAEGGNVDASNKTVSVNIEHFTIYLAAAIAAQPGNSAPVVGTPTQLPATAVAGASLYVRSVIRDVNANGSLAAITLYYRAVGTSAWSALPMIPDEVIPSTADRYAALIPGSEITAAGIEYYVQATNNIGNSAQSAAISRVPTQTLCSININPPTLSIVAGFSRRMAVNGRSGAGCTTNVTNIIPETFSLTNQIGSATRIGSNGILFSAQKKTTGTLTVNVGTFSAQSAITVSGGTLATIQILDTNSLPISGALEIPPGGLQYQFDVVGYDAFGNRINILPNWSTTGQAGSFTSATSGILDTTGVIGSGTVMATLGGKSSSVVVIVGMPKNVWLPDGPVHAMQVSGTTLYLGGDFSMIGPNAPGGAILDSSSGALIERCSFNGTVLAATPDNAGGWFVGGEFTMVNGITRNYAAHVLANCAVDAWNPNADGSVRTLAYDGTNVYAGGTFTMIGGLSRGRLAQLDPITGTPTSWNPNIDGQVNRILIQGNIMYVAGFFSQATGQTRRSLASFDLPSGTLNAWNPNASAFANVLAMELSGSTVYVGGLFTSVGGQARTNLAAMNASTGAVNAWAPNPNGAVFALAPTATAVYVGGAFTSIGGQARNYLAAVDATSGLATTWSAPLGGLQINSLLLAGNNLFIGGIFSSISSQSRSNVATVDITSGLVQSWDPSADSDVHSLAVSGTSVFVGGYFRSIGRVRRNRLAALDLGTGRATAWNPDANDSVYSLALAGTSVFAGGRFSMIGGIAKHAAAKIDATSGVLSSWDAGIVSPVGSTRIQSILVNGSTILIGGTFGTATRWNLAELDIVTAVPTAFNVSVNGQVNGMQLSGGDLFIGGDFGQIEAPLGTGLTARNKVASITLNTSALTAWNPDVNGTTVWTLATSAGSVYIGGSFSSVGGVTRNNIAEIDRTSGLATAWNPGTDNIVYKLLPAGSTMYVAGSFNQISGVTRKGLAEITLGTGVSTGFNLNADTAYMTSMITLSNVAVIAGGTLISIPGNGNSYFGVFDPVTGQLKP